MNLHNFIAMWNTFDNFKAHILKLHFFTIIFNQSSKIALRFPN
jgi:hypothetical protein